MIINQRNEGNDASAVAARVALSREFVDFLNFIYRYSSPLWFLL